MHHQKPVQYSTTNETKANAQDEAGGGGEGGRKLIVFKTQLQDTQVLPTDYLNLRTSA